MKSTGSDGAGALVGWLGGKPAYALAYGDTAAAVAAVRGLLSA